MGLSKPAGGGVPKDGIHPVGGKNLTILLGGEEAGDQGVYPDFTFCPLAGEVLGKVVHRCLGQRISKYAGEGE